MPGAPAYAQYAQPQGPIGHMRPTGMTMLLFFVTLGIWAFIYYYQTQEEMKRHSGEGIGGVIALVLAIFVGIVSPFILSHEVGSSTRAAASSQPVSAITGAVVLPGDASSSSARSSGSSRPTTRSTSTGGAWARRAPSLV